MLAAMRRPQNLRQRGRYWYGRFHDAAGRRREVRLSPRLDEARRLLAELERNARRARVGLEDEIGQERALAPLVDEYLAAQAWRPTHARAQARALRAILARIPTVRDLTAGRVEAARNALPGSARTRNYAASAVATFARWLRRAGIARPPLDSIRPLPAAPVKVRRSLSPAEAARILAVESPVGDLVALLLGTGLRLGEALALTWGDLGSGGVFVATSKNGTARTVPIAGELRARLLRARAARGADSTGRVILSLSGAPGDVQAHGGALLRAFQRAVVEAGVDPVGVDFHALRHTYATWAADAGATGPQLMALLGWKSVQMTARYVHRDRLDLSGVVARMGQGGGNSPGNPESSAGKREFA